MKKLLFVLLLLSSASFAEKISLQCKSVENPVYDISMLIDTDERTLRFGTLEYVLNYVSETHYHAYRVNFAGGEILLISRESGEYIRGGAALMSCIGKECSGIYTESFTYKGECKASF
jgi:hypothetical protein